MSRFRLRSLVITLVVAVVLVAAGIVVGLIVKVRVETGTWRVPDTSDLVRVARQIRSSPSRTIFLEQRPADLTPGDDDAVHGMSSVLAHAANKPVRTRGWTGTTAGWRKLVACLTDVFAPFDVVVTDRRPNHDDFIMVAVGGRPADIGVKERQVTGLAPFNGDVIPRAVVYGFTAAVGNDPRAACETIAMEVGHAYGLDHEYACKDVMTYLPACGPKAFTDADVPCGEKRKRACEGGAATQNSFRHLLSVLGAHRP